MTIRQPRYSKEEFARRGDEIYETQVRQQVEENNHCKIVAIDTSKPEILKSIRAKLLSAIALKPVTPMPKSGLFALVLVMFVVLADAPKELHDYWVR